MTAIDCKAPIHVPTLWFPDSKMPKISIHPVQVMIMSEEERRRPMVRPVRTEYVHEVCGEQTRIGLALAETFAVEPKFYGMVYCQKCGEHAPVKEFEWLDGTKVGS